jgi:hypothetical protein
MSEQEKYQIAKAYVDKQFENMKKNGLKVKKVSAREYEKIVKRIARDITSPGTQSSNVAMS